MFENFVEKVRQLEAQGWTCCNIASKGGQGHFTQTVDIEHPDGRRGEIEVRISLDLPRPVVSPDLEYGRYVELNAGGQS